MQTNFTPDQLADPALATAEAVIRKCVHCGFCTATCPTYVLLGDELDSPRGRIYLIKDMLENERAPTPEVVKHVDRCLSCLACMTTCPSGVNYMHLVDHARAYIDQRYQRPLGERLWRAMLTMVLPYPARFRFALKLAILGKPFEGLFGRIGGLKPLTAMLALTPREVPAAPSAAPSSTPARKGRVAILKGCAEPVLRPEIRAATVRLLNRCGYDVTFAPDEACCGALVHHMGKEEAALASARRNVDAWMKEIEGDGLDAIIITASGCGTTIKDYGHMLRTDPAYADKATRVAGLAQDVSEFLSGRVIPPAENVKAVTVAYHAACSLQHGQKITDAPRQLLSRVGFTVKVPVEAHLCCGSAGTYNILQPDLANQLGDRKAANLTQLNADIIATGNIGCAMQIGQRADVPVVHLVELLDWATGGPRPARLENMD